MNWHELAEFAQAFTMAGVINAASAALGAKTVRNALYDGINWRVFTLFFPVLFFSLLSVGVVVVYAERAQVKLPGWAEPCLLVVMLYLHYRPHLSNFRRAKRTLRQSRFWRIWFDGIPMKKFAQVVYSANLREGVIAAIFGSWIQILLTAVAVSFLGARIHDPLGAHLGDAISHATIASVPALLVAVAAALLVSSPLNPGGALLLCLNLPEMHWNREWESRRKRSLKENWSISLGRFRTPDQARAIEVAKYTERCIPGTRRTFTPDQFAEVELAYRKLAFCLRRHCLYINEGSRPVFESLNWASATIVVNDNLVRTSRNILSMLEEQPDPPARKQHGVLKAASRVNE